MITKEQFLEFVHQYQAFNDAIGRIETALSGRHNGCNLYDSDWYNSVGLMLDIFLESHFTDDGQDLVNWWLFEDVDHIITQKIFPDFFTERSEIEYDVNELEDLWNYLIKYKEDYILND